MAFEVCQEQTVCMFVCIGLCAYTVQQACSSFVMQCFIFDFALSIPGIAVHAAWEQTCDITRVYDRFRYFALGCLLVYFQGRLCLMHAV